MSQALHLQQIIEQETVLFGLKWRGNKQVDKREIPSTISGKEGFFDHAAIWKMALHLGTTDAGGYCNVQPQ